MKTAATIDVTVPENRKLELELPPEVPAGKAKLLVMVEEQPGEAALPEAHLVERDGFLPSDASTGGTAGDGGTSGSGGTTTTGGSGGSAGSAGSGGGAGAPSCAGTPAPTDDPKLAAVIGKLHDQLNPLKAPGGAFAIILGGKLTHVVVSGSKVSNACDPITPETLFRTGQITEVVTTMATLALVDQKKLSLTAPITDAIPSFQAPPGNGLAKDLTLAHLLADRGCYSAAAAGAFKCSTLADSVGSANVPL